MKTLTVLPNFTILAEVKNEEYFNLIGKLRCFCDVVSSVEHVDTYRITPSSFWRGLNNTDVDFIDLLEKNSKETIPESVLKDLTNFKNKFGKVILVGDDCLSIKDKDILTEVLSHSKIKDFIYNTDENLIFFYKVNILNLSKLFERELGYPIKRHSSQIKTFIIELKTKEKDISYSIKEINYLSAFKTLYSVFVNFNEEDMREKLKIKRNEINSEDINTYMNNYYENRYEDEVKVSVKQVSDLTSIEPLIF